MMMNPDETIAAQATAPGGGLRGIVRISGKDCDKALERLFARSPKSFIESGSAGIVSTDVFPWGPETPVPAKIYYWPQGLGFTREKSIELHTVGSQPLIDALLRLICTSGFARMAEPGEFTFRAFLSGRIDLVQAEAILGVIEASDPGSLDTALSQLAGGIGAPFARLKERLFETLCHLEAGFDFAEEEIEFLSNDDLRNVIAESLARIETTLRQMESRADSSQIPRIALVGRPNAGKSSLFNTLGGKSKAIVSAVPGTTRDYLECELENAGLRFRLIDTAGREEAEPGESPEKAAKIMAELAAETADIVIFCLESARETLAPWEEAVVSAASGHIIKLKTKADLFKENSTGGFWDEFLPVSSETGSGIDDLKKIIGEKLIVLGGNDGGGSAVRATSVRCYGSLVNAKAALVRAAELLEYERFADQSLIASEIRRALEQIGLVLGTVHTDDILDAVFSRFCIGK